MIQNNITLDCLERGLIKKAAIPFPDKGSIPFINCKVVSWFKRYNTIIVKLKPPKNYPLGHKFIYRSLEELV